MPSPSSSPFSTHYWKFIRTGGLDQVVLESGADLLNLENLDQKHWVALSCPVAGLEIDEKTLTLIDGDGDGRIRVPEILAAVKWCALRQTDVGGLLRGVDGLPLKDINHGTPEGAALLGSARRILSSLGKHEATEITTADTCNTARIFAGSALRGDGVVSVAAAKDDVTKALINDIIASSGGAPDVNGGVGVSAAQVASFYADITAFLSWSDSGKDVMALGADTVAASAAINAVRVKVDDFFARCRLAAFDARALAALNHSENEYFTAAAREMKIMSSEQVKDFPLAAIGANRSLPLRSGVNPAWAAALATLQKAAVVPVFGSAKDQLTETEWNELCGKLSAYDAWLAGKAGASVEKLGVGRAKIIASGSGKESLIKLLEQDKALEPAFKAIGEVNRLTHYYRDLRTLLHNFVNFTDFYSRDKWAVFQAGTLYLDSRSTELCIRVDGPNPLAAMSKTYIAYCSLTRPGGQKMNIAACFTQGDSDYLFVGRHGVFYDRAGKDWDAVITSLVDNPISIRQAFWSPYKKFIRMIEERVAKRAAAAEAASDAKLSSAADAATKEKSGEAKKVDVGAVAAIGVAIAGGVSALTLILGYVFQLKPWQYPLVLVGLIIIISGPSMILAWLKLRQRTLGPILEGNGWAVNGRVKINIPFGTVLTDLAVKPAGSRFSLEDPYEDKEAARSRRRTIFLVILFALAAGAIWVRWDRSQNGRYFWQKAPVVVAPATVPPATVEAPNSK